MSTNSLIVSPALSVFLLTHVPPLYLLNSQILSNCLMTSPTIDCQMISWFCNNAIKPDILKSFPLEGVFPCIQGALTRRCWCSGHWVLFRWNNTLHITGFQQETHLVPRHCCRQPSVYNCKIHATVPHTVTQLTRKIVGISVKAVAGEVARLLRQTACLDEQDPSLGFSYHIKEKRIKVWFFYENILAPETFQSCKFCLFY